MKEPLDNLAIGHGREPQRRLRQLQRRFRETSRRHFRAQALRLFVKRARWQLAIVATLVALASAALGASPFGPIVTLRHWAAYPNCKSARAVGLASAKRGELGYWKRNDSDFDGIACEPWGRH